MKIKVLAFINISLLFFAMTVSAVTYMYKWVDANGDIQYTERPPSDGIDYETIVMSDEDKSGKSIPIPVVKEPSASNNDSPQDKQADSDKNYNDWRSDNCKVAKQNLEILEAGGRIRSDDGEGLLTDEEIAAKIKDMQAKVEKFCGEAEK
jgi:hypothetical protein